jgi:two-component system phosphate regulon sensor histidine kinase PhoR
LTVISGYLDALADDAEVPPHWRKPLSQMRSQAVRMNRIVADLLELSRLEGTASIDVEQDIDVAAMLEATARLYASDLAGPTIRVQATSRALLRGSAAEIESVVRNLLSNAVRHTPVDGTIDLFWHSGADGARLVVDDTGEGIAEEFLPRITERFFRIDPGRSREGGGIGLGLSIVKHVLGRHDAELDIESTLGEGSRFICRFPPHRVVTPTPIPLVRDNQSA